jgi:hypothetical protein
MSVLIEDSPRAHLSGWITESVASGSARGAVITPWATPWQRHPGPGKKPCARDRIEELLEMGIETWFDPTTHSLQMSGVGDFRYYQEYDLWDGPRGDLSNTGFQQGHVGKVFAVQDALKVKHLAPTVLLHTGLDINSSSALDLAREAMRRDAKCWLSVSGTASFWASGHALDAHIGALATLQPAGWFLTVVRTATVLPVPTEPEEVHGLCRTARALSEISPVHISHGDLTAVPAVAAGARSVGSGWDQRQRVCSYGDYSERDSDAGSGGGWYKRPTLRRLLGNIPSNDAIVLGARAPALVRTLGGLPPPDVHTIFDHHMEALSGVVTQLRTERDPHQRFLILTNLYEQAQGYWPQVQSQTGSSVGASQWVDKLLAGLRLYGSTEGW